MLFKEYCIQDVVTFQNISCLRLIQNYIQEMKPIVTFQNISCLRLILAFGILFHYAHNFKTFHVYG